MANFNSADTMTLQDFVEAAALYPYSKDTFDIVKESSQMELMMMCLRNNELVTESFDLSAETIDDLAVMTESGSDTFVEAGELKEKIKGAGKAVWNKILKGLRAAMAAIAAAWSRMVKLVTGRHKTYGKDKLEALPSGDRSFTIDDALSKAKKMSEDDQARCYQDLLNYMKTPVVDDGKQHMKNANDKFGYVFVSGPSTVRKTNSLVKILYAAAQKSNASVEAMTDGQKKRLAGYFTVMSDGSKNTISIPQFTDDVFGLVPNISEIINMLIGIKAGGESANGKLRKAQASVKSLTAKLKRIYNGDGAPTVDQLPKVTRKKTKEELEKMSEDLNKARDDAKSTVPDSWEGDGDSEYTELLVAFNSALAEFNQLFVVYSGVAIQALADSLAAINFIDKANAKLRSVFDKYVATKSK